MIVAVGAKVIAKLGDTIVLVTTNVVKVLFAFEAAESSMRLVAVATISILGFYYFVANVAY